MLAQMRERLSIFAPGEIQRVNFERKGGRVMRDELLGT
jgi:hypothetical protein